MEPSDEINDLPRARHYEAYERHRREAPKPVPPEPQIENLSVDPAKWKPVRIGLTMVFWGWVTILAISGLLTAFWLSTIFMFKAQNAWIPTLAVVAESVALVGGLASFAGQCLCVAVPRASHARGFAMGSVAALVVFSICVFLFLVLAKPPDPIDNKHADAEPPVPEVDVPKVEPPVPGEDAPMIQPPVPGASIPKRGKLLILAAYLASQVLFILFLKRVALFFNVVFLAESTGGYLTLVVFHTVICALFPPEAMLACFFWVIMLALEFVLMIWFLILLAGTRRAIL